MQILTLKLAILGRKRYITFGKCQFSHLGGKYLHILFSNYKL